MEHAARLSSFLHDCALELGITITEQQANLLLTYKEHLTIWNRTTNLIGTTDDEEFIVKHIIDSLAALRADNIPKSSRLLDIGSGAGLPGIPLAIVRPDLFWTLLEPVGKKSSFLHYIVGVLKLPHVVVRTETIEQFSHDQINMNAFDYVVSRALRYQIVLRHAAKLLVSSGKALLFLSKPLNQSVNHWHIVSQVIFSLPCQAGQRVITALKAS